MRGGEHTRRTPKHGFAKSAFKWSSLAAFVFLVYRLRSVDATALLDSPSIVLNTVETNATVLSPVQWLSESNILHRANVQTVFAKPQEEDADDARRLASIARSAPIPSKPYKMVMCTRIFNEARYLEEWITYHYLLGFDHFMLDNHASTDNTTSVLEPYIRAGLVTLTATDGNIPIVDSEEAARSHCYDGSVISNKDMDWVSQIDLDEFLVFSQARVEPKTFRPTPAQNYMDEYSRRKESVVQVTRLHFGTNNHAEPPTWPNGQADTFTERKILDYPGNFWPKTMAKAGYWRPLAGAAHATQHCAEAVEGWSRVTAVHQIIPPRPDTISEWEYLQQWPVVHDPFHIAHFQTRSLSECLAKQTDPKTRGSWRAAAGNDSVCNAWHPTHPGYEPHLFTEHLALKNSLYNRATRRIMRTGGLFKRT